jgi:type IV pilus assembly protein PilQ
MISILALRALVFASMVAVQGVAVVSTGDQTEVIIEVDGHASYQHSLLGSPPRIVVDISSASLRLPQNRYPDINRGGVRSIRSSQFQPGVVRVVVDLAEETNYRVSQADGRIVVSFANRAGSFEAWSSSGRLASAEPAAVRPRSVDPDPLGQATATPRRMDQPTTQVPVSRPPVIQAVQPEQPRITVEFRNTPMVDVVGTFADFSGRSIVPGQGVGNQTVTATIQGQPWDEAMRAILAGQGLAARELASGIIMVTSLEAQRLVETQEEIVTRAFPLQFMAADSVAPQVRELLAEGEGGAIGTVAVNKATNTLIISSRQSVVDRMEALLPVLDRRTPQVTVKVRIMSVSRSRARDLGFRYELIDEGGGTRVSGPRRSWPPNRRSRWVGTRSRPSATRPSSCRTRPSRPSPRSS